MAVFTSPMAGKVLSINVKPGDTFHDGDVVVILESMKMEIPVFMEGEGVVAEILTAVGASVSEGAELLRY